MNVEGIVRNAKVLVRADTIIAEIRLRALVARSGLQVVAVVIGLFGAVMLGFAAYMALERLVGPIYAALIIGAGAVLLATVMWLLASAVQPGRDLELAQQLRESATDALMADLRNVEADVMGFAQSVRRPLDSALTGLIVPLASILLKTLRRSSRSRDET